jgi:hypothetical protein
MLPVGVIGVGVPVTPMIARSAISTVKGCGLLHGPYPNAFQVRICHSAGPGFTAITGGAVQIPVPREQPSSDGRYHRSTLMLSASVTFSR